MKKQKPLRDFLEVAREYTKRYLSHTEEYKKFKDNEYYHITKFTDLMVRRAWKDPKQRRRIESIIKKNKSLKRATQCGGIVKESYTTGGSTGGTTGAGVRTSNAVNLSAMTPVLAWIASSNA